MFDSEFVRLHSKLLFDSFQNVVGRPLVAALPAGQLNETELAQQMYEMDAVLLSHDGGEDPVFTYANRKAQEVFEYDWDTFLTLPSRLSAEPDRRENRAQMLQQAAETGFISNYSGVRISGSGRRFEISDAIVWSISDPSGRRVGQAAVFDQIEYL